MMMDGARLKDAFFAGFFTVLVFFSFDGAGSTLLMHNKERIRSSFITKVGLV
jgi:hypothetical protein